MLLPRNKIKQAQKLKRTTRQHLARVWRGLQTEGSVLKLARLEPACGLWSLPRAEAAESWPTLFLAWPQAAAAPGLRGVTLALFSSAEAAETITFFLAGCQPHGWAGVWVQPTTRMSGPQGQGPCLVTISPTEAARTRLVRH